MPLILGAQSAAAAVDVVTNSCRFNPGDSAYLSRTFGTPTDNNVWTFSFWIKRSVLSIATLFDSDTTGGDEGYIMLNTNTDPSVYMYQGSPTINAQFNIYRKLRDTSAWMHIVWSYNSDESTEADRMQIWYNGVRGTDFSTDTQPALNAGSTINEAKAHQIGAKMGGSRYLDGYLAEVVFIDGLALAPTSFGEFDTDSPTIWKPIDVSELTFGDNGFYLDFEDSSALGADVSGNSNDWTANNLAAADQSQDTPVNNFATWNNLWVPANTLPTFYQGNTVVFTQDGSGKYFGAASTLGMTAGKWYAEFDPYQDVTVSVPGVIGIGGDISENVISTDNFLGSEPYNYAYISDGTKVNNGSYSSYGDTYTDGDIIGVAVDFDNLKIYFAKNGVWQDSGDPTSGATGTGAAFTITAAASMTFPQDGAYFFACSDLGTGYVRIAANFGNGCFNDTVVSSAEADGNGYGLFEYAPPSGYLALCTKNLGSDGG